MKGSVGLCVVNVGRLLYVPVCGVYVFSRICRIRNVEKNADLFN